MRLPLADAGNNIITMAAISDVLVVLVLGGALGWLSRRLNFPNAVAHVVLGVLLGSAMLGWVLHNPLLHTLGEVGVMVLLGVAGLEVGIDRLKAAGWAGTAVAVLGIVFSFAGGYAIAHLYGSPSDEAMYLGLALGATSIGITVQVLEQFAVIAHRVADIVIAAAVIDDIIALYALGAVHGFFSEGLGTAEVLSFVVLAMVLLGGLSSRAALTSIQARAIAMCWPRPSHVSAAVNRRRPRVWSRLCYKTAAPGTTPGTSSGWCCSPPAASGHRRVGIGFTSIMSFAFSMTICASSAGCSVEWTCGIGRSAGCHCWPSADCR